MSNTSSIDNIAIFCTKSSKYVLRLSILYYQSLGIKNIKIICPKRHYENLYFNFKGVKYVFDEDLEYFDEIKKASLKHGHRQNWYLQQFLKLSYWYSSVSDCLIIDGDSILSEKTLNQIIHKDILYFTNENITAYNFFIKKILNIETTTKSFICNFCNFKSSNKDIFSNSYLNFLELVNDLLLTSNYGDFSEYQVHGTIENSKNNKQSPLKIFRRADLLIFGSLRKIDEVSLKTLIEFFKVYDVICYESNHKKNFIKSVVAHVYKLFRISW